MPEERGIAPSYEQKHFSEADRRGRLRLVASRDGRDGSITVHQDVDLHAALLGRGDRVEHVVRPGRHAWIQVVRGSIALDGTELAEGDGAATSDPGPLAIEARGDAELLVFDLG